MKSLKRLITLLLAVAMILTSVGIVAFADSSFSDITDSKVEEAVSKLVAYGIITGYDDDGDGVAESFKPDNQITRAEFAAIVTRMKGVADNLPQDSVTGFWDLDSDDSRAWARPYVKAAVGLGVVNGYPDGSFKAASPVTYAEAVKMLICAIGYETIATSEQNRIKVTKPDAEWYEGYISAAVKHGITKNAYMSQATEPANRGIVAVLTSNSVDAPALREDENGNLVKDEDGSGATESNMTTITGVITETFYTGLDSDDTNLNRNEIVIDATNNDFDGEYTLSRKVLETIELDNLIGRKVTAYYDNLETEITSLKVEKTSSTIIKEQNVVSASSTSIKTEDDNGKRNTENISGATFIVNGKYVEDYDFEDFKNGTIEIFTALGKKIVVVSSYEVFVVNSFDRNNEKIFLKYANYKGNNYYPFPTRPSDKPQIYVASSGNTSYKLTSYDSLSLSPYDVINYLESPEGAEGDIIRKMYVTKGSKSGKVTAGLGDERMVEIDDKVMYITQQYHDFESTSNDKKAPFANSDSYTYYVDYCGQIAAVNYSETASSTSWSYGYIVYTDTRRNEIGILETNDSITYYELKDSVKIDGSKKKPDAVFEILSDAAEEINANATDSTLTDGEGYEQPIRYSVSGYASSGLKTIDAIDTILGDYEDPTTGDNFTYDGSLRKNESLENVATSTSTTKVTAMASVEGEEEKQPVSYSVNSSTYVFYVPKDRTEESSYQKMSASTAFAVSGNRYVEVFGVDPTSSNKLAKMVIVYGTNPTLNFTGGSPYLIVTNTGGKGDNATFTGYKNGAETETTIIVSEDKFTTEIGDYNLVEVGDIEEGDIIRYITDNSDEAVAIELLYDCSEDAMYDDEAGETDYIKVDNSSSKLMVIFGEIISKDTTDSNIEINADSARTQKYGTNTKVFKLTSGGIVETSSMEEVYDGTEGMDASKVIVFVKSTSSAVAAQTIYIIE